jgi:hypothetical protein
LTWCQQTLRDLGFTNLRLEDVFPDGSREHCRAYVLLRERIQIHILSHQLPILSECERPTQQRDWNTDMQLVVNHIDRLDPMINEVGMVTDDRHDEENKE